LFEARAVCNVNVSVSDGGEILSSEPDHPVGHVDTMNFTKVPAQRQHQPARSTANLERAALARGSRARDSIEFLLQTAD
jgi:hypothetical protein